MLPALLTLPFLAAQVASRTVEIADEDTRAWWRATEALSGDDLEGRDTGSPGHARAADIVARSFERNGLKPAGENGGWLQTLRLEEVAVAKPGTRISAGAAKLRFLHDITLRPSPGMPRSLNAPMVFRGYCGADALGDVRGKVVLCYGWRRAGLTNAAERQDAVEKAGAVGLITIADPGFTIEPTRWPAAYARTMTMAGEAAPAGDRMLVATLAADALPRVLGRGADAARIIAEGSAGRPLANIDLSGRLVARFDVRMRALASSNVLGLLPGTDPVLKNEVVVLSAHLDGYGRGEPVDGDGLYNGTLDDAAYVALLQRLAERRGGKGYRRTILLAAFTGEEKGLFGARHFVAHPTVPSGSIVANINLDQIRPIFPLDLLTVHGLDDTGLGDAARRAASALGISVQRDPEPERNLMRRADHWPFIQAGIPATGFVFGYRPGTESEVRYREWYHRRYHKPQDDVTQPMDWTAAAKFNRFFYDMVDIVADADQKPAWRADSPFRSANDVSAATAQACPPDAAAVAAVTQTIRGLYVALAREDPARFAQVTSPTFYAYDGGERFKGAELLGLVRKGRNAGMDFEWNPGTINAHVACDMAWASWENVGRAGPAAAMEPVTWLESATLSRRDGRWTIDFLHAGRAKKPD
jgi:hypothetical protein